MMPKPKFSIEPLLESSQRERRVYHLVDFVLCGLFLACWTGALLKLLGAF